LSTRLRRVQVLTILVPFIRETRHMDVCPETGSGQRYRCLDREVVPSSKGALSAVSRVGKPPTWTRTQAALGLAGSPGTGTGQGMCQVPWCKKVSDPGYLARGRSWPPPGGSPLVILVLVHDMKLPVHTWNQGAGAWDRGDLCPRYTDCQQLRDERRYRSVYMVQYCIPVVLYTILYYYTTILPPSDHDTARSLPRSDTGC